MRTMPRLLLLLFCMSVVTMMFIARCGLSMDGQFHSSHHDGLPVSSRGSPGEKALREVMRRREVEHIRDKSVLQEKITSLESQLAKVQGQVINLTVSMQAAQRNLGKFQSEVNNNQNIYSEVKEGLQYPNNGARRNINVFKGNAGNPGFNQVYEQNNNINTNVNHGETHLAYPNDGLNPLPKYHQQNDRSQVLVREDRKPVNYLTNDTFYYPQLERQNDIINNIDTKHGHFNQFETHAQIRLDENRNFAEQNGGRNYRTGLGNSDAELNLDERGTLGMSYDEIAIREGVFHDTAAGSNRLERSAPEPMDDSESKREFNQPLVVKEDVARNQDQITSNKSEPIVLEKYFLDRLQSAEILKGQQYKTEYELIPFNRFIFNRIFLVDPGLGKRVVEKPIGSKKKDLNEILYHAVEALNRNRTENNQYTYNDFIEGMYRSDPVFGSHYELFFANKDDKSSKHPRSYVKLSVFRPFAPPMAVQQSVINTGSEWINIILPLSKRVDTFRIFMDQFITVCIKRDKRIYLTVVYFGTEGLKDIKSIMGHVARTHKFKHMKLVTLNETFTRGRGLQIGALNWKGGGDILLFFCDVDIVFTLDFLERCRVNAEKGQRVYYPIVFSLYNPKIVYSLQDVVMPSFQDQLVLSKDTGFWRDFGYGMTCLYRSDFLKIKGFDEQITGWGGEDVFLYQKFVRSDYFVVRATDPAIFHLWHEKFCDPTLSTEQYRSCIRSKALNEASHAQLGLLAFKDEVDVHRGISERNRLLNKEGNV